VADAGGIELDEDIGRSCGLCEQLFGTLDPLLAHTRFWHRHILNLDVEIWAFIHNNSAFASLGDVKRLHLLFSHDVGYSQ
jgi:hypothetical protein